MSEPNHTTTVIIAGLLAQAGKGDRGARDQLLAHASERLRLLVRKQLRGFRLVARWEQTDDVLQGALLRLCRALDAVAPASVREFFALSSTMIRRELIDLKRHHYGLLGVGANHQTRGVGEPEAGAWTERAGADTNDPALLAEWTDFHAHVERLPAEEREVFDLLWYQGLTGEQAAELLGASLSSVNRRWRRAKVRLHGVVRGGPDIASGHGALSGTKGHGDEHPD